MTARRTIATVDALVALVVSPPATPADASFVPSIDGPAATTGSVDLLPVVLATMVGLAF